jgi:hypothetical protein
MVETSMNENDSYFPLPLTTYKLIPAIYYHQETLLLESTAFYRIINAENVRGTRYWMPK